MADRFDLVTPVLLVVFNRPHTTQRVFETLREAKPERLFIAADGPRPDRQGEVGLCAQVRGIAANVDWDCKVNTLFREENFGAGRGVSAAIDWFFDEVEEGIILEDDCLPEGSFFRFCQELLTRYRHDNRVMHINGNNFASNNFIESEYSYHFCSYPQAWGWATWRRAWSLFDPRLSNWPDIKEGRWLMAKCWSSREYKIQKAKFERMHALNPPDIWDYMWHFSVFSQHGLAVVPKRNLISNIGFSETATHTKHHHSRMADLETAPLQFPLIDPPFVMPDYRIDRTYRKMMIRGFLFRSIAKRLARNIKHMGK